MFEKGLKAQYATCFTVCLLCFAFGLIVKPSLKQHPMLQYSIGFLVLHYHLQLTDVTFEFETTGNNELIYTVKRKAFINDTKIEISLEFGESDEDYIVTRLWRSFEDEDVCRSIKGKALLNCSRNEFSIKQNIISLFHIHPNSENYYEILEENSEWSILYSFPSNEQKNSPHVIQREFSRMIEIESGLQRTKIMLTVYVCHYNSFPGAGRFALPLEKKIRDLSLEFLPTSEGLLTNAAYSGFLMPYYVGQIAGAFLVGFLVNFNKRKKMLITISLTLVLSKLLLLIPKRFNLIYVQKQLTGFSLAGFYIVVPTYICEVAEENLRGVLFSFLNLFLFLGRLRLFYVDGLSIYHHLNLGLSYIDCLDAVSIVLTIIFLVASPWLIESPTYLLLKNKTDEAKKSLVKLGRNADEFESENSTDSNVSNGTNGWLKNVTPNFVTVKGLIICCALIIIQFLSFNDFKENFNRGILKKFNYLLDTYNILWIEISLQLIALVFVLVLIDRAGRRFLLLVSCLGMAFCSFILVVMGFAVSFSNENSELLQWMYWVPVVSWAGFHFNFHLGLGCIPWILVAEILNTKARGPAMAFMVLITVSFSIILHFNLIPTEHDYLPIDQALNGALGALFVYFCVPETKQKSLKMILEELKNVNG